MSSDDKQIECVRSSDRALLIQAMFLMARKMLTELDCDFGPVFQDITCYECADRCFTERYIERAARDGW